MEDLTGRQIALFVAALIIVGALVSWGKLSVLQKLVLNDSTDPITKQGGPFAVAGHSPEMRLKAHEHPSLRRRFGAAAETTLLWGTFAAIWISAVSVLIRRCCGSHETLILIGRQIARSALFSLSSHDPAQHLAIHWLARMRR
jgi:hypothetical protein